MNGVHDMGGVDGFGPVDTTDNSPFHHEWEKQVLAITVSMGATGTWNLDQSRAARESLPADFYLSAGYYRIWFEALQNLLLEHELVSAEELTTGYSIIPPATLARVLKAGNVASALRAGSPVNREAQTEASFSLGEAVTVRDLQPATHTRLPAYIRNKTGMISHIHGCHVFPDSHAVGAGEQAQWLYNVRFESSHLWETQSPDTARRGAVQVDCWESYLKPAQQAD